MTEERDRGHVTTDTEREIQYWMYRLNCSRQELLDAVASVGSRPEEVEQFIHILHGDRQRDIGKPD